MLRRDNKGNYKFTKCAGIAPQQQGFWEHPSQQAGNLFQHTPCFEATAELRSHPWHCCNISGLHPPLPTLLSTRQEQHEGRNTTLHNYCVRANKSHPSMTGIRAILPRSGIQRTCGHVPRAVMQALLRSYYLVALVKTRC